EGEAMYAAQTAHPVNLNRRVSKGVVPEAGRRAHRRLSWWARREGAPLPALRNRWSDTLLRGAERVRPASLLNRRRRRSRELTRPAPAHLLPRKAQFVEFARV